MLFFQIKKIVNIDSKFKQLQNYKYQLFWLYFYPKLIFFNKNIQLNFNIINNIFLKKNQKFYYFNKKNQAKNNLYNMNIKLILFKIFKLN